MRWALREAIFLSSSLNNVAQKVTLGWGLVLQKRSCKLLPHWTCLVTDNNKSRPFSKGSFHLCHKWKRNDTRSDTFDQGGIASSVSLWNGNREEHIRCCLSQTVCDRQTAFWKIVILDNVIQLLDTINKSHISRKQMPRRKRKLHHYFFISFERRSEVELWSFFLFLCKMKNKEILLGSLIIKHWKLAIEKGFLENFFGNKQSFMLGKIGESQTINVCIHLSWCTGCISMSVFFCVICNCRPLCNICQ